MDSKKELKIWVILLNYKVNNYSIYKIIRLRVNLEIEWALEPKEKAVGQLEFEMQFLEKKILKILKGTGKILGHFGA